MTKLQFFKLFVLAYCLIFSSPLQAKTKAYYVLGCRENSGMFSMLIDVRTLVKGYDLGCYYGIEVDFKDKGAYYDKRMGFNWWNYYFEPIQFGIRKNVKNCIGLMPSWKDPAKGSQLYRDETYYLFNKYFKIKHPIIERIDDFYSQNFKGFFVIGVHYRGTDKSTEAPRVSYEKMYESINYALQKNGDKACKIFIATDEQEFIRYLSEQALNICYVEDCIRSENAITPVHINSSSPYKAGEDAIVDCMLLSKCDLMIKTSSNFNDWATYINPKLEFIHVE